MSREWGMVDHVERALELADDEDVVYHLRSALQYEAVRMGELEEVDT